MISWIVWIGMAGGGFADAREEVVEDAVPCRALAIAKERMTQ